MIPRPREPLFTDEERRDLIHAMHSSWVAEALLSWMPRDEKFLAGFDRVIRAEIEGSDERSDYFT